MNKKQLFLQRKSVLNKYVTSGGGRCQVNSIRPHTSNGLPHELAKTEVCYRLLENKKHYIVEACRKSNVKRKIDVVCLDTGDEIEIIDKNNDKDTLERYKREGVVCVFVGKPIKEQIVEILIQ